MTIKFFPSQIGGPLTVRLNQKGIPDYTSNPIYLLWSDIKLFWQLKGICLDVIKPWNVYPGGRTDELYPSTANLTCIGLHTFLIVLQGMFLLSLPVIIFFSPVVPLLALILYVVVVSLITAVVARILNGDGSTVTSDPRLMAGYDPHEDEFWMFLNGVSVGRHWLQSNTDRLCMTFRRKITGVHNETYGILFDLIQCLIERNFCYATQDIRNGYETIKDNLMLRKYKKVVLVLHSQGGIEGGAIVDWLLDEVPQDVLQKLEIYTFGNAANHFNNPHRTQKQLSQAQTKGGCDHGSTAIRHIEHYANYGDFVARWGVMSFIGTPNRYMGRLFARTGPGHLLNQHYLSAMFPLDLHGRVLDSNEFMETPVGVSDGSNDPVKRDTLEASLRNGGEGALVEDVNAPIHHPIFRPKVKDLSRLWLYRNGMLPPN